MGQVVNFGRMVVQHFLSYGIKMIPFMALYGYHPPSITSSPRYQSKVQEVEENIENQQQVLQLLKDNLNLAQN
jgi:hypothetical protein